MNPKEVILRAINCDKNGRIFEAQHLYQEGIEMLMESVENETDEHRKKVYYERIKEYIDRAEQIKARIQKHTERGEVVAHIPIDEDSVGNSYQSLIGRYLKTDTKEVLLEEPYLYEKYQFQNLITFFELLVKSCPNLKYIRVVTKTDTNNTESQQRVLDQLTDDMATRSISVRFKFDNTLHDRKIVLSNGFIIKIGRGLHFYKANNPLYSLGLCDFDFRKCKSTDVDVWRTKSYPA